MWWVCEIKRARRLSQALAHLVIARANLFTDHKISKSTNTGQIRAFQNNLWANFWQSSNSGRQWMVLRLCITVELFCSPIRNLIPKISVHDLPCQKTMKKCSRPTLTGLSLLRHFLPGTNPPWMMECMSWAFPMWYMYSAKSSGNNAFSCNIWSTRVPSECPWIAEIQEVFGRNRVQSSTETFSSVLLLLPGKLSKLHLTMAKYHQTLPETFLPGRQILQAHHFLDELYHSVVTSWSWILTLQNNLGYIFLDQRLSIFVHDKE